MSCAASGVTWYREGHVWHCSASRLIANRNLASKRLLGRHPYAGSSGMQPTSAAGPREAVRGAGLQSRCSVDDARLVDGLPSELVAACRKWDKAGSTLRVFRACRTQAPTSPSWRSPPACSLSKVSTPSMNAQSTRATV